MYIVIPIYTLYVLLYSWYIAQPTEMDFEQSFVRVSRMIYKSETISMHLQRKALRFEGMASSTSDHTSHRIPEKSLDHAVHGESVEVSKYMTCHPAKRMNFDSIKGASSVWSKNKPPKPISCHYIRYLHFQVVGQRGLFGETSSRFKAVDFT